MRRGWFIPGLVLGALVSPALAQPGSVFLTGVRHEYQRYNNCGPATLGMALSFWGSRDTQYQIAPVLKPNKNDKNVNPDEMADYARGQGFGVHLGVAGDLNLLKRLIAGGFPVIIETWFVTPDNGGMGHYRLLVGYNDRQGTFNAFDSYYGPRVTLRYGQVDGLWQVFNRTYLVVYVQSQKDKLSAILGNRMNAVAELRMALERARSETQTNPANAFAWFNLGSTQLRLGSVQEAARAFDQSRRIAPNRAFDPGRPTSAANNWPWRMLWYQSGPYEAYFKTGRYQEVITLANDVLRRVDDHEESYYWRGLARQALGNLAGARADFQAALRYRPGYREAAMALRTLGTQRSSRIHSFIRGQVEAAGLPRVVRRFLGNGHPVGVALDQAGTGNAGEAGLGAESLEVGRTAVAHRGP
jgi:tetratricopeptide (TPR) repeat protein